MDAHDHHEDEHVEDDEGSEDEDYLHEGDAELVGEVEGHGTEGELGLIKAIVMILLF